MSQHKFTDFLPLIIIGTIIVLYTLIRASFHASFDLLFIMCQFEGAFFVIFGAFKLLNWTGFVNAYQSYDIIAKRSRVYGYTYPLIELALGVAYLAEYQLTIITFITFILMIIGTIGVAQSLANKKQIPCACLGVVFKLPMTKVTLFEDLLMGLMALVMFLMSI